MISSKSSLFNRLGVASLRCKSKHKNYLHFSRCFYWRRCQNFADYRFHKPQATVHIPFSRMNNRHQFDEEKFRVRLMHCRMRLILCTRAKYSIVCCTCALRKSFSVLKSIKFQLSFMVQSKIESLSFKWHSLFLVTAIQTQPHTIQTVRETISLCQTSKFDWTWRVSCQWNVTWKRREKINRINTHVSRRNWPRKWIFYQILYLQWAKHCCEPSPWCSVSSSVANARQLNH